MLPEQQQRILGYFIEEARDHLNTIEQGLLNLQSTLNDPELINEVFRAAHSIKGGAAMLGLTSIQHTAHRLEDCFKVLKENPIQVDQKLESLFLGVSDTLKALLEQLSGPFGLSEETANTLMSETEPVFQWLNQHLELLVQHADTSTAETSTVSQPTAADSVGTLTEIFFRQDVPDLPDHTATPETAPQSATTIANDHWGEFQAQVLQILREMLQLFKQAATSESRRNLQQCCNQLVQLGQTWNLPNWCNLSKAAATAIGNSENSYLTLAKIVITEIKQAQELVLRGRETEITISQQLEALWDFPETALMEVAQELLGDVPSTVTQSFITPTTSESTQIIPEVSSVVAENSNSNIHIELPTDSVTNLTEVSEQLESQREDQVSTENAKDERDIAANIFWESEATPFAHAAKIETNGPEVGLAELNTLADLFEGETPELDESWQQEEVVEIADSSELGVDISETIIQEYDSDLADFLSLDGDNHESQSVTNRSEDFGLLFGDHLPDQEKPLIEKSPEEIKNSNQILSDELLKSEIQDHPDTIADLLSITTDASSLNASESEHRDNEFSASFSETEKLSNSLDEFFIEQELNANILEEVNIENYLQDPQNISAENLNLDNLFVGLDSDSQVSTNGLETVNNLFDEQPLTVLEFIAPEQDVDSLYQQEIPDETDQLFSSVVENEIAKELEESLFAAATGEILRDSGSSINSRLENFDLDDLNATFFQSEEDLDLILDSENNNFSADLTSNTSIVSNITNEVSPTETQSFSQVPETLDFVPEFTNQLTEISSIDNQLSFADFEVDVSSENHDDTTPLPKNIDHTDNSLFATTSNLNSQQEQDLQAITNIAIDLDTNIELSDIDEDSESDLAANLLAITNELPTTNLEAWVIPISELTDVVIDDTQFISDPISNKEVAETPDLDFGELTIPSGELAETTIQDFSENLSLDIGEDLLTTEVAETPDLDFGELTIPSGELTETTIQDFSENLSLDIGEDLLTTEVAETPDLDFGELTIPSGELAVVNNDLTDDHPENSSVEISGETELIQDTTTTSIEPTNTSELFTETIADIEDEFADLEALLEVDLSPSNDVNPVQKDDFAALEALLGEDNAQITSDEPQPVAIPTSALKFTPLTASNKVASAVAKDEFSDLEKLLAETDQTISQSTPAKQTTAKLQRPSNRRQAKFEETMKVPVKQLDDMSNLVGELVVNRNTLEQDHERLRQSLDNLLVQVQQLSDVGARMQELYERSLLEASLLASRKTRETPFHSDDSHADRGFSELEMDRFTPFHTLSQEMIELIVRVRESASDIDFVTEETERVARQFRQVTNQLQEGLTRARMVPFSQTIDRLRRGVRDNAIKCGKQVELMIEGGDTLIDKMILDHLTDPLTHMLNNAIAHGIETPDIRQAAGKPPVGIITIRAFHQGNQTVISVGDDGAGIDTEKTKTLAVKRGLITPAQAKTISRLEIYDLLFQAGFSTKDEADEISGRGVGMDVVRSEISEIRGTVNTDSSLGKGTTFTIRLPLTLSICKALCCVSDKARIAFPMDGVEDTLDIPTKNIQKNAEGQSFISWRDTVLPFRPLKELLTFNRQLSRGNVYGGNRDDDMISVVVVRSGNTLLALQIDQVLSEQEIVIKQFEGPAPKPIGVAGATVLGDGRIMPIADVLELLDIFQGRMSKHSGSTSWQQASTPSLPEIQAEKIDPTVLIVDDSITVRELLSLTFNKAGYRVEQARDGQEAWDKLRSGLPCDIVFCDIEMPRCDGLELLSRIQKDSNLNHLPIAMLTSRGADKHRQMAIQLGASGYFTKPYLEEALLEAAVRMLKGEKLVNSAGNG
ncbi:MAG TPA: response regulator [Trichormus sp. M33_DOE_039]|nr:response regulator [Trichormus sp. M33_DOE_039]